MNNYCVITTVNLPTKAIEAWYEKFGNNLIIVGDKKTPQDWVYKGIRPMDEQNKLYAPDNHYARKNMGYLEAIRNKADLIYDTDDDNSPNENWGIRSHKVEIHGESGTQDWFNVYAAFDKHAWPRGFSLNYVLERVMTWDNPRMSKSSIQQGLSNGEADVDAIFRLTRKQKLFFKEHKSIRLQRASWCPFNSQSTWWFPKAYPLMYLPVTATFRMTDIWRSFVAQRCLWEIAEGVTFHSPAEVFQDRNEHDLMKDFEDEVPGYLKNDKIVEILSNLQLKTGEEYVTENLLSCYMGLAGNDILPMAEIDSVKQWIKDYEDATRNMG